MKKQSEGDNETGLESIVKLNKDLKVAAKILTKQEARYLVDTYYQIQEYRKATANQCRIMDESKEPHEVLNWFLDNAKTLENQIKKALDYYTDGSEVGTWLKSICGIGPVIAAGLLAHIDITKAPTAGHIWSFAGLNPAAEWSKGEKRPWNAKLKTLCWKIGQSFVKVSNNENDVYGKLWKQRKEYEIAKNEAEDYAEQAKAKLAKHKIGKDTEAYKWYAGCFTKEDAVKIRSAADLAKRAKLIKELAKEPGTGLCMLPPAHIQQRAERWAVKIFLSHVHAFWYKYEYGVEPPAPYPIAILGHAHKI